MTFEPNAYRALVFDCDGVLFDSNALKAANIRAAAESVADSATVDRFVAYFTANNGVPREIKIRSFFDDSLIQKRVLEDYNRRNAETLSDLRADGATLAFLERCAWVGVPMHVLSGGSTDEVVALIDRAGIARHFVEVLGGPTGKAEHLERLSLPARVCFFGDSRHDHEVAERFGYDFVFLTRHTQFEGWRDYFATRPDVRIAEDFASLLG